MYPESSPWWTLPPANQWEQSQISLEERRDFKTPQMIVRCDLISNTLKCESGLGIRVGEMYTVSVTPEPLTTALSCFGGASVHHKSMFPEKKSGNGNDLTLGRFVGSKRLYCFHNKRTCNSRLYNFMVSTVKGYMINKTRQLYQ